MKSKILKILLSLFSIIFVFYPISYSINNIRILIFSLFTIVSIFFIIKKLNFKISEKYYFIIILAFAIFTRLGVVLILSKDVTQVLDFSAAFNSSFDLNFNSEYYRVFTHWIMYPTIVNFLYKIFGDYQIIAYMTNAIILILVAIMIYKITILLFKEKKYGFYSSLLYILWPSNIFYTLVFTQEHLCSLLLLIVIYLFLKIANSNSNKIVNYIFSLLIGILLAISSFLKNFSAVFFVGFIIFEILSILKHNFSIRVLSQKILYFIIMVLPFTLCQNIIFNSFDNLVGEKVVRNIVPCYLNVGLRDFGTYNAENYDMYFNSLRNNNYDYDKTNFEISKNLLNHWRFEKGIKDFVKLMDYKSKIILENDNDKLSWVNRSLENSMIRVPDIVSYLNNLYYWCLGVLMMIGLINLINKENLNLFLVFVIFLGSMLLLLLVEAQNRYIYSIQPLICILSLAGIIEMDRIIERKKHEKKNFIL